MRDSRWPTFRSSNLFPSSPHDDQKYIPDAVMAVPCSRAPDERASALPRECTNDEASLTIRNSASHVQAACRRLHSLSVSILLLCLALMC